MGSSFRFTVQALDKSKYSSFSALILVDKFDVHFKLFCFVTHLFGFCFTVVFSIPRLIQGNRDKTFLLCPCSIFNLLFGNIVPVYFADITAALTVIFVWH